MDSQVKEEPQQTPIELSFIVENSEFSQAADEYREIWNHEGERTISGLEDATGLNFWQKHVQVEINDKVSNSGFGIDDPMSLYYDFDADYKKAVLVHELGHRILLINLKTLPVGYDPEQLLDLFLYDVWVSLYGREFANRQVKTESEESRKKVYDFEKTWEWALSMTKKERHKLLKEAINQSRSIDN